MKIDGEAIICIITAAAMQLLSQRHVLWLTMRLIPEISLFITLRWFLYARRERCAYSVRVRAGRTLQPARETDARD